MQATYGITAEEYERIYQFQGGCCFICRRAKGVRRRLAVDHRHSDGLVRGLLCTNCNRNVVGKLREDLAALDRAIDYLLDPPAVRALAEAPEQWRPIEGFDGYDVSDQGRVRSWQPYPWNAPHDGQSRILRPLDNGNGYQQVTLVRQTVKHKRNIHDLVARSFHGPPVAGDEVRHRDNDKTNNRASNLRWGSHGANAVDLVLSGSHNTTVLNEDSVREIRKRLADGERQSALAAEYGVGQTSISAIKNRKTWSWVSDEEEIISA